MRDAWHTMVDMLPAEGELILLAGYAIGLIVAAGVVAGLVWAAYLYRLLERGRNGR